MKMAATVTAEIEEGVDLGFDMLHFCRTKDVSDLSQVDVVDVIGHKTRKKLSAGHVLLRKDID